MPISIRYDAGTLLLEGDAEILGSLPGCRFDDRTKNFRAEGRSYRAIVETLLRQKIPYVDQARGYKLSPWTLRSTRVPFPHQGEAVETWWNAGARGVVVLPTGTGKTFVAVLAIHKSARPSLVVTPTIDLLNQWYAELTLAFGSPVGLMGGGHYDLQPLTVTTYDSAYIHLERWGNRFGLLVFDECHHLPGQGYSQAAIGSLAPYRLGLTATPERGDGREDVYPELIGPILFRREISELKGEFLAEYRVERIEVDLGEAERLRYDEMRAIYRGFVQKHQISLGSPSGWQRFLGATFREEGGRAAFQAYREQKRLATAAPAKLQLLEVLLQRHVNDRVIIFTYDNVTVYQIARRFLVPAITHQTKARERQSILAKFANGELPVVVTSQVLNEGVDVPAANVGVVLSGTGSVREHVQRLGRLLRKQTGKQALLYEVVTRGTGEEFTSLRRRQHQAYQP